MSFSETSWYINYGNGSSTGYYAVAAWAANHAYSAGNFIRQNAAPSVGNERCFVCIVAGTSSNPTEPTWTVTRGAKTTDNTITWQECTGMPGTNGDTTNAGTWVASTGVGLGIMMFDSITSSLQICSTSGTTKSGSPPSFSATAGVTTTDNTATWTSLGLASGFSTAFGNPHARLANALASTWGAAGNTFAVSSIHAETQASGLTLNSLGTLTNPCKIYCISNSTTLPSATLATSATISTTGNNGASIGTAGTNGCNFFYGIGFSIGSGANSPGYTISNGGNGGIANYFEQCTLTLGGTSGGTISLSQSANSGSYFVQFYKCNFLYNNTGQRISIGRCGSNFWGCTFAASGTVPTTVFSIRAQSSTSLDIAAPCVIRDCDFTNITGTICGANDLGGYILMQNCKIGSGATLNGTPTGSPGGMQFKAMNCDSGATNYRYSYTSYMGSVVQETTVVRTGSLATDGTTPISWKMVSASTSLFTQAFISEEVGQWNDLTGSAKTVTVYLTSNTSLNNNDFWAEVEYPGSSSAPLGSTIDSRMVPLATPAGLTSDSSTWGGSITNKYKITLSMTPQMKGPVKLRFYLAKASTTVYVDPYIYIS